MKSLLLFFVGTLLLLFSCQRQSASGLSLSDAETDVESLDEVEQIIGDTTPQATTILWVDKKSMEYSNGTQIRTAKAKVTIHADGKLDLHSFVKEQPLHVRTYLKYRLNIFRITKIMMDSGHVQSGDQYVQLRYFLEMADKFR